jgi:hypothetical protein
MQFDLGRWYQTASDGKAGFSIILIQPPEAYVRIGEPPDKLIGNRAAIAVFDEGLVFRSSNAYY